MARIILSGAIAGRNEILAAARPWAPIWRYMGNPISLHPKEANADAAYKQMLRWNTSAMTIVPTVNLFTGARQLSKPAIPERREWTRTTCLKAKQEHA